MEFQEGEVYCHSKTNRHVMILGKAEETDEELVFAILEVDPTTMETMFPNELVLLKSEVSQWEHVEIV